MLHATQPVGQNFPSDQPFDKAYASPDRQRAALYDTPCPAELAEDAWGLGMTMHWLLTGRDDHVPGSPVRVFEAGGEADGAEDSAAPANVSAPLISTTSP